MLCLRTRLLNTKPSAEQDFWVKKKKFCIKDKNKYFRGPNIQSCNQILNSTQNSTEYLTKYLLLFSKNSPLGW